MEANVVEIVLKYGGWWKRIPRTNRRKYECGRQKTVRMELDKLSLKGFEELIKDFYDPAKSHVIKIAHAVPNSNPKEYKSIKFEARFLEICKNMKKVEMFLSLGDSIGNKFRYVESIARKNPPRKPSATKQVLKEFLHVSESESDVDYPANQDDNYVAVDELFDEGLHYDAEDEDEILVNEKEIEGEGAAASGEKVLGEAADKLRGVEDVEGAASGNAEAGDNLRGAEHTEGAASVNAEAEDEIEGANPEAVEVENEEYAVDDADDCYSIDEYHSMESSGSEDFEDIDEVEAMDGAAYNVYFVDPVIKI